MDFKNIVDILRYRANCQPMDNAYIFLKDDSQKEEIVSYGELHLYAQKIAAMLRSFVSEGDRVVLIYQPGLEFVSAFFGCLYAGVIAVPAYPPRRNKSLSRLQSIVSNSEASTVLTTVDILSKIGNRKDEISQMISLRYLTTDNLQESSLSEWKEPSLNSEVIAFIQYTSGSTGTPKGVMLSHGNLLHNSTLIHQCFEHSSKSKGVIWLPPYHDMGLIGGIIQPLFGGFPVILMSPMSFLQRPVRWLQAISTYKATTSGGPDFAYSLCTQKVTDEEKMTLDLSSWDLAFTGAEPVRAETINAFTDAFAVCGFRKESFYPCYGMAETTLIVSGGMKEKLPIVKKVCKNSLQRNKVVSELRDGDESQSLVSCGQSKLNQQVLIVNPDNLMRSQFDEIGEIWVSGNSIAKGYHSLPEETEFTFQAYLTDSKEGPFMRTGDLGFIHDNELFITGRLKDLIIIRGRNYYPQDIEYTVAQSHPALRENHGAAFAVDINGQEQMIVVQEIKRSYLRCLDKAEVIESIHRSILKSHEVQPHTILLLKTGGIPRTSSGKIQRFACRNEFLNNSLNLIPDKTLENPPVELTCDKNIETNLPTAESKFQPTCVNFHTASELVLNSVSMEDSIVKADAFEHQGRKESILNECKECGIVIQASESIQYWLVSRVVEHMKTRGFHIDIYGIDRKKSLTEYGLDSLALANLSSQLECWLDCRLSPTVFYEHQDIVSLAQYLEYLQIEKFSTEIDRLADDEVELLLKKILV
jgi:acyl-CoA synthetase (AMP-forming)/AMP-acid ligase II/acyl carrier protein